MRWFVLIALTAAGALAGAAVGLPSPTLLSGMVAGIAVAPGWHRGASPDGTGPGPVPALPLPAVLLAEAVVGVVLGTYVKRSTLEEIGADLVPIVLVTTLTLAATVLSGLVLARVSRIDRATAAFGMIAGGATGVVVIARQLGADQRLVAVMQYLRVITVTALTPLLAATAFGATHSPGAPAAAGGAFLPAIAFTVVATVVGLAVARRVPLPAPTLLVPMLGVAALSVAGLPGIEQVPGAVQDAAFAIIGLQVGLRFTPESLRSAGRILLPAMVLIGALLVVCFGLAVLLATLTGVSTFDAYLATTPGGLYAVLGTAVDSGADTPFVLAVQVLRLFVMLLVAPLLARLLTSPAGT